MTTGENRVVKNLKAVAAKLTANFELQKDLMQEMFIHLVQVQTTLPGRTFSWYVKSCEFHARNCLKRGRSIDSYKRSGLAVTLSEPDGDEPYHSRLLRCAVDPVDIQGELITNDIVNLITPHLSDMQQEILCLLMRGLGVRETARELGITHPAVIKHRKKIARIAREFLQESEGVEVGIGPHDFSGHVVLPAIE